MAQQLKDLRVTKVSLVDRGANSRRFAVLKRDGGTAPVRKAGTPTFAQLQAAAALRDWLPGGLASLVAVVDAALSPAVAAEAGLETMGRLTAIANAADEFKEGLVLRAGAAIQAGG